MTNANPSGLKPPKEISKPDLSQQHPVQPSSIYVRTTTGRVRWFDGRLGYGFIVETRHRQDIYCHQKSIQVPGYRTLRKNQRVIFDLSEVNGRRVCRNIIPIEDD